jgi:hypothetical protein
MWMGGGGVGFARTVILLQCVLYGGWGLLVLHINTFEMWMGEEGLLVCTEILLYSDSKDFP